MSSIPSFIHRALDKAVRFKEQMPSSKNTVGNAMLMVKASSLSLYSFPLPPLPLASFLPPLGSKLPEGPGDSGETGRTPVHVHLLGPVGMFPSEVPWEQRDKAPKNASSQTTGEGCRAEPPSWPAF